jgi:hypothetical protein
MGCCDCEIVKFKTTTSIEEYIWSECGLKETGRHGNIGDDHGAMRKAVLAYMYVHSCTPPKAKRRCAH